MNMLGKLKLIVAVVLLTAITPLQAYAVDSSSTNYRVRQVFFGAGGQVNESSPNFTSQVSVGETGVGNFKSSNYQAYAGFNTTSDPFLEIVVTAANLNLGVLTKTTTATANGTFYVRAWQSSGYVIQTSAPPPTDSSSYFMQTNTTPTASTVGTEQFGMNLVANTLPVTFGANPVQANSASIGQAACMNGASYINANHACYNQTNLYNYTNGDIIAWSNASSSSTIYTMSYIFNISGSTPGEAFTFNQNIVATATY